MRLPVVLAFVVLIAVLPNGTSEPVSTLATGRPLDDADLVRCDALPAPKEAPSLRCPAAIRPGAGSNACTLNFVVTDGIDLYIGAAGHCSHVGKRLRVSGLPGEVGTAVISRSALLNGDWAFYRIDKEDEGMVDPTMCRFGGPTAGPLGAHRIPLPGDVALHFGHGAAFGSMDETKGRAGAPVIPLSPIYKSFVFVGSVAGGDSGSPVRALTGEAIGIAIASTNPGYGPQAVIATNFADAVLALEQHLDRDVWTVEGRPLPDWLDTVPNASA